MHYCQKYTDDRQDNTLKREIIFYFRTNYRTINETKLNNNN